MRLFVLGATGKTGTSLVAQALARGHSVTAFGRAPFHGDGGGAIRVVTGNPMNSGELASALSGHDAVLFVIGSRGLGRTSVRVDAASAAVKAMSQAGVTRLIILSSSLVDANVAGITRVLSRTLLRHVTADQRAMEAVVAKNNLDWTVVRPAMIHNGPLTRAYGAITGSAPDHNRGAKVSRSNVAHLMLEIAESGTHSKQVVWIRGAKS
jgi:putative NADH-flavin reductase